MNQKMKTNNEKKKKKKNTEFEFCKACNLNHDQGQNHKYLPNHKKSLSNFLSRFHTKLADIRFFLRNPTILRPELASRNRIWCVFCDFDIHETGSYFACAKAISHLASEEHLKKLKHFMWKYGGGMDRVDTFRISEADVAKWEKKCEALGNEASSYSDGSRGMQVGTSNDIRDELSHENINSFENNSLDNVNLNISNVVMPLQYYTNEYQISNPGFSAVRNAGPSMYGAVSTLPVDTCSATNLCNSNDTMGNWNGQHSVPYNNINCASDPVNGELCQVYQSEIIRHGVSSLQDSQNIPQVPAMAPQLTGGTRVPALTPQMAGGNVHTGAPPPWFEGTDTNQLNFQPTISNKSMSISNKSGKSHKLNPKRVGAAWAERRKMEMEMEKRGEAVKSDYNANWLPNFGRVWQSGSRKESRKEFEKEKQKISNVEIDSEMPIMIQPYISKRMRKDAGE
ncbi:COILED-COIL DOMAIN-CONTAINING PROTEIN 84 [Salix purpurea]|uniref:COILED-COIL DOMAIN-CONTAINING PROTEIN 84 n=1 Tax=Salix purpurea TaxID=77065 RepID=A0A9Q0VIW4_SALPP|nr:COILED-COIL DOMAIN-CONTAINING PROTEIN 84 [Salix purpurea]